MSRPLTEVQLSNGTYLYDPLKVSPTYLRLTVPAAHGDLKEGRRGLLPPGVYQVESVLTNYYGTWIRVRHKGLVWDIEPRYFVYDVKDQTQSASPVEPSPTETQTESIDKLFLELSQFTKAKTAREIDLESQLKKCSLQCAEQRLLLLEIKKHWHQLIGNSSPEWAHAINERLYDQRFLGED